MDRQTEGHYKILKDLLLLGYLELIWNEKVRDVHLYTPYIYQVLPDGSFIPNALYDPSFLMYFNSFWYPVNRVIN